MGSQVAVQPKGSSAPGGAAGILGSPIVGMLGVFAIFYFLVIRPQQRQAKELRNKVDALKTGDRVLTSGGIYGVVAAVKGRVLQVKIAENVRVEVDRSAISQVITENTNGNPAVISGEKNS